MTTDVEMPLYESVAKHITRLVEGGTFRVGDRIPSVRSLSTQLDVSVTTVLGAYRLLESRGLIQSRPQSGYFVKSRVAREVAGESMCDLSKVKVPKTASPVSVRELVMKLMEHGRDSRITQFGPAIPNPKLLPTAKLNRTLARMTRTFGERVNAYATSWGVQELRVQVARRALAAGCTLTPDEVVITSGGQEAIALCLQAFCKAGETVALESPCYYGFLQAMEAMGIKGLEIPAHPTEGLSLEALEMALRTHDIKAVLAIPNFNNPLGSCMPAARKKALVAMLAKHEIPLLEDDIYGDLHYGEARPTTCKSFDKTGNVILCDSFSKTLSPGLRVGWMAPGKYMEKLRYHKLVNNLASPALTQFAVADFLANGGYERHLRRLRVALGRQLHELGDAVLRHFPSGTKISRARGGHVLWVQMPEGVDSLALYARAIEKNISIAPGPLFSTKGLYRNFIRLNGTFYDGGQEGAIKTLGHLVAVMV
ncbi:MAG: PLP-dependent aminotransferase family protein [Phycisphaerae bacterium]